MKRTYLVVSALGIALLGGMAMNPVNASSRGWDGPRLGGPGDCQKMGQRQQLMAEILKLTPEQQTQIQALRDSHRQAVAPLRETMRTQREALHQAMQSPTFDEAAVRSLAAKQAETRTEMIVSRAKMQSEIQALLSPEQRELAAKLQMFAGNGRGRHGHGPDFAGL